MTWQDDLRELDRELAAGTISRGEHRRRSEDVLAEASGAPPLAATPPPAPSGTGSEDTVGPEAEPAAPDTPDSGPMPEAGPTSEPEPTPEPGPKPEPEPTPEPGPTSRAKALLHTDRRTTAPSPADASETRVLRVVDPGAAPFPSAPVAAPPTGSFPSEAPDRSGPTWVAISLAVLLALGAVIGGAWWLGQGRSTAPTIVAGETAGVPTTSTGTGDDDGDGDGDGGRSTTPEPALADRLPLLPGEPGEDDSTMSVDTGVELGLYPRRSADILSGHGVREVVHRSATDGEHGYFLLAIPTPGPGEATAVVERMRELTLGAGFEPAPGPPGTLTGPLDGRRVRGTWYASGEVAVNLWVSAPDPADADELGRRTRDALAALHAVLPPR